MCIRDSFWSIACDATLNGNANFRLHDITRRVRATHPDLFLHRRHPENLVRMRCVRHPLHGFKHNSAAHTIVPSFAQVILRAVHYGKWCVWDYRIAGLKTQGRGLCGVPCAYIKKDPLARIDACTLFLGRDMNISDACNGADRGLLSR